MHEDITNSKENLKPTIIIFIEVKIVDGVEGFVLCTL